MPKGNSAAKQARASERKRIRNQTVRNRIRTGLRKFRELAKTDPAQAKSQGRQVVSWLDRAAKSKIMHRNAARRNKTAVLARINALAR